MCTPCTHTPHAPCVPYTPNSPPYTPHILTYPCTLHPVRPTRPAHRALHAPPFTPYTPRIYSHTPRTLHTHTPCTPHAPCTPTRPVHPMHPTHHTLPTPCCWNTCPRNPSSLTSSRGLQRPLLREDFLTTLFGSAPPRGHHCPPDHSPSISSLLGSLSVSSTPCQLWERVSLSSASSALEQSQAHGWGSEACGADEFAYSFCPW